VVPSRTSIRSSKSRWQGIIGFGECERGIGSNPGPARFVIVKLMAETEEETKVIDILVAYPKTEDHLKDPIHAVDKAMGWDTKRTQKFVDRLMRGHPPSIVVKTEAINRGADPIAKSRWWWERPSS